ncbi:MAG: hypothetical protein H6Q60_466 [Oscillospiraceae bacterium]|nr:hypothetical protein [Oscillospiraceae bacterium]
MLKKLSAEKQLEILEIGIAEFAEHGPAKANINVIARNSGVSVGVLYKYYENKDALFLACLRHALTALERVISEVFQSSDKMLARTEKLIRALQRSAKEQPCYHILYHEITAGSCRQYASVFAREIEEISAAAYGALITQAQAEGTLRQDMDPRMFAFFFDNLLMMLQFSYCCDYYRERFEIYCGRDALSDDDKVASELLKFFESAFTTERSQIQHQN